MKKPSAPAADSGAQTYALAWASAYVIPTIIVARDLAVIWQNEAAVALLAAHDIFSIRDRRITCLDKNQVEEFRTFCSAAPPRPSVWVCDTDGTHVLIRAEGIRAGRLPPATALTFFTPDSAGSYIWADLGKVFGLTPAEVGVVTRSINGERADAIASALGVTMDTVRTHLRRSYGKLSVNSREQLFSLLNGYRLR